MCIDAAIFVLGETDFRVQFRQLKTQTIEKLRGMFKMYKKTEVVGQYVYIDKTIFVFGGRGIVVHFCLWRIYKDRKWSILMKLFSLSLLGVLLHFLIVPEENK